MGILWASRFIKKKPIPMQGPDVLLLQNILTDLGFKLGEMNGIFAQQSVQAVKEFQQSRGLKVDGIVGPETWRQILKEERRPDQVNQDQNTAALPVINVHVDTR